MKKNQKITCLLLLICQLAYAQKYIVANPKENVIYFGISNSLDILVENYRCTGFTITTDNGRIARSGSECSYQIEPDSIGRAKIKIVSLKKPQKLLGIATLRVKQIPNPTAMVAGKAGGEVRKNVLRAQVGITAVLLGFDFDVRFEITAYAATILRGKETVFAGECFTARFGQELKQALEQLEVGDRILFTGIKCKSPDNRLLNLQPLELTVIE